MKGGDVRFMCAGMFVLLYVVVYGCRVMMGVVIMRMAMVMVHDDGGV